MPGHDFIYLLGLFVGLIKRTWIVELSVIVTCLLLFSVSVILLLVCIFSVYWFRLESKIKSILNKEMDKHTTSPIAL